jgi:DNA-binding MarR family transcriptional regulator
MSIARGAKPRPAAQNHESALERGIAALSRLATLVREDGERATRQAGVPHPMAVVLCKLEHLADHATVSALARAIGCNMGNLSGTLDRLEEGGLIERVVSATDRRSRFIRLTPKGRRLASQILETFRNERVCTALKQMSVQQLEAMTEIIGALNDSVKTDIPSEVSLR